MAAPTRFVNPNAEVVSKTQALMVNVAAARGLQNVLKTNLGECFAASNEDFTGAKLNYLSLFEICGSPRLPSSAGESRVSGVPHG